ncbi:hypothetical protein MHY87_02695 [Microvirga sp. ACRRW]|uniref:hypothetical protein n=1 Tax=Microvirga sp. ACRRW TaxID=2918205 RepID=UPI001EF46A23|nr:hypothetical protein [Microvirga sp. ACRRW]MCG7391812.1 hypothetical protein [Microvirga sp. ACRRW]
MSRAELPPPGFPDCDDTLRRLSDVLQIPLTCRKHRCRREGLCQGGFGPPCYFENHGNFVEGVRKQMQEYREYWGTKRRTAKAMLRR